MAADSCTDGGDRLASRRVSKPCIASDSADSVDEEGDMGSKRIEIRKRNLQMRMICVLGYDCSSLE